MTIPFVLTYSFEAVLKDGLSVVQNSRPNVVEVSKLSGLKIYFQTLSARCRTRSCLRSRVLQPLVVRLSPWQVLPPELCILHRNSSVSHFLFSLLRGGIFIISHLETGCQLLLYQIMYGVSLRVYTGRQSGVYRFVLWSILTIPMFVSEYVSETVTPLSATL